MVRQMNRKAVSHYKTVSSEAAVKQHQIQVMCMHPVAKKKLCASEPKTFYQDPTLLHAKFFMHDSALNMK